MNTVRYHAPEQGANIHDLNGVTELRRGCLRFFACAGAILLLMALATGILLTLGYLAEWVHFIQ